MTDDERQLLCMIDVGILQIDNNGLIWKCMKKHKEWTGYRTCTPHLIGYNAHGYIRIGIRNEYGKTI